MSDQQYPHWGVDPDYDAPPGWQWQPVLWLASDQPYGLDTWFSSEVEAREFVESNLVGRALPGEVDRG